MRGISIAFAVVGCALFGVALLVIFGLFAIGLSLTEGTDAVPADDRSADKRVDFGRSPEAGRRPRNRRSHAV
jgi:hypothetical protein